MKCIDADIVVTSWLLIDTTGPFQNIGIIVSNGFQITLEVAVVNRVKS
jgi:hypothetical protein